MWGNLHGWLISAVLAALILGTLAWFAEMIRMSPPSGLARDAANLAPIDLPVSPDAWPILSDGSDCGDLYRKVIATWNDDVEAACSAFVQDPTGPTPDSLQLLIDARHCKQMTLFAADLPAVINYDADHPKLESLFAAGQWAVKAGLSLHAHGKAAGATPFLEAAFALGEHLYHERLVMDEYQEGTQLMADAAYAQCRFIPVGSEAFDKLTAFQKSLNDYRDQRVIPIWQLISSIDPQVIDQSAGDVLAFARHSQEKMWRVEAALKLGRYRYNAGSLGDQLGANRALRDLCADPDPAVAAAAAAARDLTLQTYRTIH
jgi:hypothetical protein